MSEGEGLQKALDELAQQNPCTPRSQLCSGSSVSTSPGRRDSVTNCLACDVSLADSTARSAGAIGKRVTHYANHCDCCSLKLRNIIRAAKADGELEEVEVDDLDDANAMAAKSSKAKSKSTNAQSAAFEGRYRVILQVEGPCESRGL